MTKKLEIWSTLIIGLIAALSWTPYLLEKLSINKFEGKIISQYVNITKDKKNILFLYKLSVVSRNKDFFLKDIDLNIKFKSSNFIQSTSRNNRLTVFTFENPKKLIPPDKEFINNLSVLPKDEAIVGYLLFSVPYERDEPIENLEFEFKSFNNKIKRLIFKADDIIEEKLLFDDTIWEIFDSTDTRWENLNF